MKLSARPPARRSPLYAWFSANLDKLGREAIDWQWMMSEIARRGLVDRNGNAPTLGTARKTLHRARRAAEPPWAPAPTPAPARPFAVVNPVRVEPEAPRSFPFATPKE